MAENNDMHIDLTDISRELSEAEMKELSGGNGVRGRTPTKHTGIGSHNVPKHTPTPPPRHHKAGHK